MKFVQYFRRHPLLAFLLFCLIPAEGFAQVTTGDVLGTATDQTGAVIVNADVTLLSADTGARRSVKTDGSGNFVFAALQPGRYTVRAAMSGFSEQVNDRIDLAAGARLRVSFVLSVGAELGASIDVAANPALVTDSSRVETALNATQIRELPQNGRNFVQLVQLSVGVNEATENALGSGQRPDDRRQTSSISANAQSDTLNQQLVDGIDNNEGSVGTIGVRPSLDAIAEVHVVTSNYPAEIGKTAGAIVNVLTRAGTNQIHGSAFEFFRNDALDARNFFARADGKPKLRQNQFGGSIGGPLQRDRTFIFASYEGYRTISSPVTYQNVVPTLYEQQHPGDFSDQGGPVLATPNAVALKFFALYPAPNTGTNIFSYTPRATQNSDVYDARVDRHWSANEQTFVRYAHNQVDTFIPGTLPAVNGIEPGGSVTFPGPSFQRAQQIAINHLHIASPRTLIELKAGYTHLLNRTLSLTNGQALGNQFGIPGSNYDAFSTQMPYVSITGFAGFGGADSLPLFNGTNTFQYSASVFHTVGRHSIKAGVIFLRRQIFNQQNAAANAAGSFSFNGQYAQSAFPTAPTGIRPLVDFLAGRPFTTRRVSQLFPRYTREFEPSAFIQDDYRITNTLTLNLGLRWDMWTPLKEKFGHISMFSTDTNAVAIANVNSSDTLGIHTDYTSVAPRIGMSWNVRSSTVIHGAVGATYFRDSNGPQVPFANAPYTFVYTPAPLTTKLDDALPLPAQQSTTNLTGAVRGIDPNFKNSLAEQFHFDVQQQVGNSVVTVGYTGVRMRRLRIAPDINLIPQGKTQRPYFAQYPSLNSSINIFRSQGMGSYNALQTTLVHPLRHGLTVQLNYTWAHALTDTQAFSQSVLFATVDNSRFHQLEYSNSDLDQRHRFTMLLNYQIPISRNIGGAPRKILRGWQINAIDVWGTGFPFTVTNSTARTGTGATSDRPNQTGDASLTGRGIARWFDTAAFSAQALGTVGTARRASVYGPHYRHFDLSVFRNFVLRDNVKLQLRAESFNLTNTPSFAQPNAVLGTATFGTITATRLGSTPRQMQVAARVTF